MLSGTTTALAGRISVVLLEIADELGVNSNQSRDNAHKILCKCVGFVGTDDRGIHHRLTGTENTNEKFFGGHSLRSEGEREGHGQRETFRNSDDDQCHRDDRYLSEGDALLTCSTTKTCESEQQDGEKNKRLPNRLQHLIARRSES